MEKIKIIIEESEVCKITVEYEEEDTFMICISDHEDKNDIMFGAINLTRNQMKILASNIDSFLKIK